MADERSSTPEWREEYLRRANELREARERSEAMERDFLEKKVMNGSANNALDNLLRVKAEFAFWLVNNHESLFGMQSETARSTADQCNRAMVFKEEWTHTSPVDIEPWYSHWVGELTAQGLHAKTDIATVLAILSTRLAK